MSSNDIASSAMQIIIKAGEGRSNTYRAIDAVTAGDFAKATELIGAANEGIKAAHVIHTTMIQSGGGWRSGSSTRCSSPTPRTP